mmetsp:Transcript_115266/g.287942  ORF Transcript_115266/g.287942 Transcript_115266/m.287942 type:complete len:252 (+) Transcript_115266:313-1068(+)
MPHLHLEHCVWAGEPPLVLQVPRVVAPTRQRCGRLLLDRWWQQLRRKLLPFLLGGPGPFCGEAEANLELRGIRAVPAREVVAHCVAHWAELVLAAAAAANLRLQGSTLHKPRCAHQPVLRQSAPLEPQCHACLIAAEEPRGDGLRWPRRPRVEPARGRRDSAVLLHHHSELNRQAPIDEAWILQDADLARHVRLAQPRTFPVPGHKPVPRGDLHPRRHPRVALLHRQGGSAVLQDQLWGEVRWVGPPDHHG